MVYLSTFGWFLWYMYVIISYMDPVGMEYWSAKMFGVRSAMMSGDILPFRGCPEWIPFAFYMGVTQNTQGSSYPYAIEEAIGHNLWKFTDSVSPKQWKWNMAGYLKGIQYKVYYYWRYTCFWMNHDSGSFRVSYIRCSLIPSKYW